MQAPCPEQQQQPPPTGSLLQLPDACLGLIWQFLRNVDDTRVSCGHFYCTCRRVRESPAINAMIKKVTINFPMKRPDVAEVVEQLHW